MPAYDFRCESCGHEFEVVAPMAQSDKPRVCPSCSSNMTKRRYTSPARAMTHSTPGFFNTDR